MFRFLLTLLLAIGSTAGEAASGELHITPTLVAESLTPQAGKQTTIALAMHPIGNWHGYWKNPGDAGLETRADWHGPPGVTFGPLQYPTPQPLLIAGLMNHVYQADYAELATVTIPPGLKSGTKLPISVKLDWLACNPVTCVPESSTLSVQLTVGDRAPNLAHLADFDKWRAALPRPLGSAAHFQIANGHVRLEVPLPASVQVSGTHFFPTSSGVIDNAAPQVATRDGDRLLIEIAAKPGPPPAQLKGVVGIGGNRGLSFTATPGKVTAASSVPNDNAGGTKSHLGATLLFAVGGAIVGGLLLNVMPCVFPVLSIKALSLARANGAEAQARAESLSYTAGVVLVCAGLGAVLLGLRSAGQLAGWAFQLQDVRVIVALLLLVSAIALNLAGLFELPMIGGGSDLAGRGGTLGAFWTGALAAFVATPCSGPFMGTALGVALLLPSWASIMVFGGLGFGLALPFLALGFIPALRRKLPRPGPWTDRFRRVLSLPMFATALGLAWIAGRQAGVDAMAMALGAAMMLGVAFWWIGRRQLRLSAHAWWPLIPALAFAGLILTIVPRQALGADRAAQSDGRERFDEERLATLRAGGRPVLLYFTADWCLTCKVNEKVAIERDEVRVAFAARNVAVMVGDWTNGDPAISRFLQAHGRSGVPFYLFYPAGGGEPEELPQVLTPALLAHLA